MIFIHLVKIFQAISQYPCSQFSHTIVFANSLAKKMLDLWIKIEKCLPFSKAELFDFNFQDIKIMS